MAGVKGRSGGPRANSGGARPGSGPKPKKPRIKKAKALQTDDPDAFLQAVMSSPRMDFRDRMAAALALKKSKGGAPQGKKAQQQEAAQAVAGRSLSPAPAPFRPRLVASK